MIKNEGPILIAHIRALAIQRRGIVIRPEDIEQMIVTNDGGIEFHLHDFGMPGRVAANIFIGWIFGPAAGVTDSGIDHSGNGAKSRLDSPKTAGAKRSFFRRHVFTIMLDVRRRK